MKRVAVKIADMDAMKFVRTTGVPVRIGVINDLFVATRPYLLGGRFSAERWHITHIPSGGALLVHGRTPLEAAKLAEEKIKAVGKARYVQAVKEAMKRAAQCD